MSAPLLKVQAVIGEGAKQLLEEATLTLPLEAIKVRNIEASIANITSEVIRGKVMIEGTINKQIFFVSTDDIVHHLAEEMHFSTFVNIAGAQPGMNAQIAPEIEHLIFCLLNPTTLLQKLVVNLNVVVTGTRPLTVTEGTGPLILAEQIVGEKRSQFMEETPLTLTKPALRVTEMQATVREIAAEVIVDKVVIQGVIYKQAFYVGTDNIEYHQAAEVPFSHFVEITGALPEMQVQIQPVVEYVGFKLTQPLTIEQKVVIELFVRVTQTKKLNVVLGTGPLIQANAIRGENTAHFLEESILSLANPVQQIREITATVKNVKAEVITDKVIIEGTILQQVFYIGKDQREYHRAEKRLFSRFIEVPGALPGLAVEVQVDIEHILHNLLDEFALEQRIVVALSAVVTDSIIIRIDEQPLYNTVS